MSMFCFQCQETCKNTGCTLNGMCGKKSETANLMDLLIHTLKGISVVVEASGQPPTREVGRFISQAMFATITNANFDSGRIVALIEQALKIRDGLKVKYAAKLPKTLHDSVTWSASPADYDEISTHVGVLATANEDVRSLRELLIYGLKGVCAYADHAAVLNHEDDTIYAFLTKAMASTTKDLSVDEMVGLVLECGNIAVTTMATLDAANTSTYGNPEITKVSTGVRKNPGILISGHDLKDMQELMEQTEGTGVDVYTHSEMLPANYYPAFKKYKHLAGNYGSSWWHQNQDFAAFNGPILMTTNCIIAVKDSYRNRIFTTGMAGYPGIEHIPDRQPGKSKDFSKIIALAKKCAAPTELENGEIIGGFAHNQVMLLADKIVAAVKSGAIKRFVVMAGCDGRNKDRGYFTEVAEALPEDAVILTAGCAKYRYNKLNLGDIGGIPRVLDAGQCNDSYSLAVIALKLKEAFGLEDINDLPLSFDVAWYEQKAVAVLLALLALGVKGIRLGPTLPAFLSPNVAKVLVENFNIKPTGEVKADVEAMMAGK
ncbi:MAG: hydroxylamine reductase [Victivallaceae bacterium]